MACQKSSRSNSGVPIFVSHVKVEHCIPPNGDSHTFWSPPNFISRVNVEHCIAQNTTVTRFDTTSNQTSFRSLTSNISSRKLRQSHVLAPRSSFRSLTSNFAFHKMTTVTRFDAKIKLSLEFCSGNQVLVRILASQTPSRSNSGVPIFLSLVNVELCIA